MSKNLKEMAMVDVAYELIKENKAPMSIHEIFEKISEIKEVSLEDVERLTQLYMNITESGLFVYCGDDTWDLKEGNLELWDSDGSQFIEIIEEEQEEELVEDFDITDYEDDEEFILEDEEDDEELDEETKKELKEEKEYIEVELPLHDTDEEDSVDFDAKKYDEEDYNKIMDDYEDLYDE